MALLILSNRCLSFNICYWMLLVVFKKLPFYIHFSKWRDFIKWWLQILESVNHSSCLLHTEVSSAWPHCYAYIILMMILDATLLLCKPKRPFYFKVQLYFVLMISEYLFMSQPVIPQTIAAVKQMNCLGINNVHICTYFYTTFSVPFIYLF